MSFLLSKAQVHVDPNIPKRKVIENFGGSESTLEQLLTSPIFWTIIGLIIIAIYLISGYPEQHLNKCKAIWQSTKKYYKESIASKVNQPLLITLIYAWVIITILTYLWNYLTKLMD
jgi:hypothetical protein